VVAAIDGAVGFSIPVLLSEFTDRGLTIDAWRVLVPLLVLCTAGSLCMQWLLRRFAEAMGTHFANYLKVHYFGRLEAQSVLTLQRHHSVYILSLVSRVCDRSGGLSIGMLWLLSHIAVVMGLFFFFLARQSLGLAVFNSGLLLLFLVVSALLSRRMVPLMNQVNLESAAFGKRFADIMGNILTVKRLQIRRFARQHVAEKMNDLDSAVRRVQLFHANRWFVLHALYNVTFVVTISFILSRIARGDQAASVLILFISAYATLRGYIERLSELIKDLLEVGGYIEALEQILEPVEPSKALLDSTTSWRCIKAQDLRFSYPERETEIEAPVLVIEPGDVVCITGESGQGKSTVVALLAGLLLPSHGVISVDGVPYHGRSEIMGSLIAFASQDVELFSMSLRDNLRLGADVSDTDLHELLAELNLGDWLASLPDGLSSEIGERGVRLSAGQRQRINLARALLRKRPVLLLDEPTAHLDAATEAIVVEAIRRRIPAVTIVAVTHREAVLELATKRYDMRGHKLLPY
jgi:ABC-type multidrug transport system fused ATPase/permease subunit